MEKNEMNNARNRSSNTDDLFDELKYIIHRFFAAMDAADLNFLVILEDAKNESMRVIDNGTSEDAIIAFNMSFFLKNPDLYEEFCEDYEKFKALADLERGTNTVH